MLLILFELHKVSNLQTYIQIKLHLFVVFIRIGSSENDRDNSSKVKCIWKTLNNVYICWISTNMNTSNVCIDLKLERKATWKDSSLFA